MRNRTSDLHIPRFDKKKKNSISLIPFIYSLSENLKKKKKHPKKRVCSLLRFMQSPCLLGLCKKRVFDNCF